MIEAPASSTGRSGSSLPGFVRCSYFSSSFPGCLCSSLVDRVSENRGDGPLMSISFLGSGLFLPS